MPHTLLYGGTFDPIHHGHLITCQRARELLRADRVLFITAHISPHKTDRLAADGDHRLAMLHCAIADNPYFLADGRELNRPGPSYTADTIDSLHQEFPNDRLTLLIGTDQLPKLHTWHRIADLLNPDFLQIALLGRPSAPLEPGLAHVERHLGGLIADRLRASLLATPLIEIAATAIRARVAAGLPIEYLVPPGVAEYIRQSGLYRNP